MARRQRRGGHPAKRAAERAAAESGRRLSVLKRRERELAASVTMLVQCMADDGLELQWGGDIYEVRADRAAELKPLWEGELALLRAEIKGIERALGEEW